LPIPELLERLLTAAGPSGYETAPAEAWRESCRAFATQVGSDTVGSSYARVKGSAGGPTLAIIGHIDEIGVHVTHIDDDGYLHIGNVGGWDPVVLIGQRVRILTRHGSVTGVIARKPIHLLRDDDRRKAPEFRDMHIDIGAASAEEASQLVRIGDVAVIDADPIELPNDRIVARALDNRIGCYVAAEAARLVAQEGGAPGDVLALAVTQEETTFAGARTSAFAQDPDLAIVVDVLPATDQPGIQLGEMTRHALGSGPTIARGTTLHPAVFELLYDAASEEQMPFTVESLGKATQSDADAVHIARSGIPTGLVSVPARYLHSPVEMVSLEDVDAAARLLAAFARRLSAELSFVR
jgi:putative aminopeptidase FrvX